MLPIPLFTSLRLVLSRWCCCYAGQKALCAVALTLALQQVFPCPFYVLDEIDAALDSIKVSTLARLLAEPDRTSALAGLQHSEQLLQQKGDVPLGEGDNDGQGTDTGASLKKGLPTPTAPASSARPVPQFVVLTHKPEMYEQAELIVGIYRTSRASIQPVYFRQNTALK
jgi:hypothetical protein